MWTAEEERKFTSKKVLEKAGEVSDSLKVPTMLYMLVGGSLIIGFVNFMVNTGRLRI